MSSAIDEKNVLKVFAISESSAITWPLTFISWILADLDGILFIDSFRNFQVSLGSFWVSFSLDS
jgi:hypothetical protein